MSDNDLLDPILLSLADNFEAGKGRRIVVSASSPEEWERLREFLAHQLAEGLMLYTGRESWNCKLTPKGYAKYLPRIRALRVLGPPKRRRQ
jgi:hypothetical protein